MAPILKFCIIGAIAGLPAIQVRHSRNGSTDQRLTEKENSVPASERRRELRRRRHRRKKLAQWDRQLKSAKVSERDLIADKIRSLTPGAEVVISNFGLAENQ